MIFDMFKSPAQARFFNMMLDSVVRRLGEEYRLKLSAISNEPHLGKVDPVNFSHLVSLMSEVAFPKDREGHYKKSFTDYCLVIQDLQKEITNQFNKLTS